MAAVLCRQWRGVGPYNDRLIQLQSIPMISRGHPPFQEGEGNVRNDEEFRAAQPGG
jgi:hypothetical protein